MRASTVALTALSVVAMLSLGSGPVVLAQAGQTPTFKSTTSLVLVEVNIVDKDGKPVPNLAAEDFQVKLDGQVRPVRAVTYEQIETPSAVPDAEPTVTASAGATRSTGGTGAALPTPRHRVVVILVDDLSLTPSRGKAMMAAAGRFVQALPPTDLVGLATTSESTHVNPTTDHLAVQVALPRVTGQLSDPRELPGPPVGIQEGIEIADGDTALQREVVLRDCYANATVTPTDAQIAAGTKSNSCADDAEHKARQIGQVAEGTAHTQVRAYIDAINSLRSVPGMKQLVAVSDGLAFVKRSQSAIELEPLAKAAAAAGVQVTVLTEEPSGVDLSETDRTSVPGPNSAGPTASVVAQVRRADSLWLQQGIETVADLTGGQYYRVIGSADRFFARVALSTSALYELGVEAPPKSEPGRDFTLAVSVNKSGLTVRANHHALVPAPVAPVPIDTQLKEAIAKGTPLFGIPISMGTSVRRGEDASRVSVNLDVDVPAATPGPVTLVFGLADAFGLVQSGRKVVDAPAGGGDYRISLTIPVNVGQYKMRLAAADANGEVGSVESRVKAVLSPMGPLFVASDLLTGWSGETGATQFLALESLPPAAKRLLSVLELYPTAGAAVPSDLKVHMTISTPEDTPVDDRDVVPKLENGVLRAQAPFDVQYMPAGEYVVKATVSAGGATLGTVQTTVRLTSAGVTPTGWLSSLRHRP